MGMSELAGPQCSTLLAREVPWQLHSTRRAGLQARGRVREHMHLTAPLASASALQRAHSRDEGACTAPPHAGGQGAHPDGTLRVSQCAAARPQQT